MEKYLLKIPTLVNLQTNLISYFHFFHFHTFIVTLSDVILTYVHGEVVLPESFPLMKKLKIPSRVR